MTKMTTTPRCADVARELAEPLAGTGVKKARIWLCLEDRTSWERKAFKALDKADQAAIAAFEDRIEATVDERVRLQAIRRPQRPAEAPLQLIVADGLERRAWSLALAQGYASLAGLDIAALLEGDASVQAEPLHEPLFLVCMHTRRDPCCALRGAPVYARLSELVPETHLWQTSHVGGHRFAANVIALPSGVCYGHIEPSETPDLVAAEARARIHRPADRLRGVALYPRPVQFADAWLRTQLRDDRLDAVRVLGWEKTKTDAGKLVVVELADARGQTHTVRVAQRKDPVERVLSCGDAPDTTEVFEVVP